MGGWKQEIQQTQADYLSALRLSGLPTLLLQAEEDVQLFSSRSQSPASTVLPLRRPCVRCSNATTSPPRCQRLRVFACKTSRLPLRQSAISRRRITNAAFVNRILQRDTVVVQHDGACVVLQNSTLLKRIGQPAFLFLQLLLVSFPQNSQNELTPSRLTLEHANVL